MNGFSLTRAECQLIIDTLEMGAERWADEGFGGEASKMLRLAQKLRGCLIVNAESRPGRRRPGPKPKTRIETYVTQHYKGRP